MPRPRKEESYPSLDEMFASLGDSLRQGVATANQFNYKPHPKQQAFHEATNKGRLFLGGNRSGKSVAGVMEDIWFLTKTHPTRKFGEYEQVFGRVVVGDFLSGWDSILQPIFKQWLHPKYLINGSWDESWSKKERTLTLVNGSKLEVKSNDQELEKHAGTSRTFVHFDEEPPQAYFNENLLRLVDQNGDWWMTMTPLFGMNWVYETIYEPFLEGTHKTDTFVVEVDMDENPYLTEEGKHQALGLLNDDEVEARKSGRFTQKGGLVFKSFQETVHVRERMETVPANWAVYHSMDHGFNNATCHLWHAVAPNSTQIITFHEMYGSGVTIDEWARRIHDYERVNSIVPVMRTGDPAMKQKTAESGMSPQMIYTMHGIYLNFDGVPRAVSVGVDIMQKYLKINPASNRPFWMITRDCTMLIKQMKKLHWKSYDSAKLADRNNPHEEIHKKDDHAPDAARYFFTLMPDLSPEIFNITAPNLSNFEQHDYVPKNYIDTLVEMSNMSNHGSRTAWSVQRGYAQVPETQYGYEDSY